MYKIIEKTYLNPTVAKITVEAPLVAKKIEPGQFIILMVEENGERVPFTVADFDSEKGTVTVIFQIVGATTMKLAEKEAGEYIAQFAGPLGKPTEFGEVKRVAVVGGGLGCAIAYPQAKYLFGKGVEVDIIAGFKTRDLIILEDEMKAVSNNLYITTDDGSYGEKGLVTDKLKSLAEKQRYDLVIAIGPVIMMKFVTLAAKEFDMPVIVSLNPIMIDGTGMCGGCRVMVGGKVQFACVDGPDFDGYKVDFDNLMNRNRAYAEAEKKAVEEHKCRIGRTEGH
ncbi:MAG: sulfide/dihydroorotate dehydrogenase-like FAD/NAD-binding protein [Ruminococcaceae bacterium]|nr:sulfide/dihydroorotate dehydrogenase-like FAD/NAD-binding protein [Oscillospiraceae bacterium]